MCAVFAKELQCQAVTGRIHAHAMKHPDSRAHVHGPEKHSSKTNVAPIKNWWKWLAVIGNGAIGVGEAWLGGLSAMSVASDAVHNMSDLTYGVQANNAIHHEEYSRRSLAARRKAVYWVISGCSGLAALKAGYDISTNQESAAHADTIYAAAASVALTSTLAISLEVGVRRRANDPSYIPSVDDEHTTRDLRKHLYQIDMPSAVLAVAGAVTQKYTFDVEQVLGLINGGFGVWVFRPTARNLDAHGHGH